MTAKHTLADIYRVLDSIVPDENGCRPHPRSYPNKPYQIRIKKKKIYITRVALERKLGRPLKTGFQALHTCDYRACVNPEHLYEGTRRDNGKDRWLRNPESIIPMVEAGIPTRKRSKKHD
jgi:hypothetical protein